MPRLRVTFSLFFSIALGSHLASESATRSDAAETERPNIVLVMADDQGWGDMGYNGHPVVKTPHFDQAASEGLRFDRFYAAAPVCSPTRASVMTGRNPNRSGVYKWGYPLRPQETTIAERLQQSGYATAHFGKWHLGSVRNQSPANPGKHGFDAWLSAPNFYDNDPILSKEGTAEKITGESSIVAADAAIEWMRSQPKEKPFFAVVWFGSPHSPHRAADEDRALYADQPKNQQDFLGEVTGMDRAFGKIRNELSTLGIRDNTILWYCSDNGALPRVGSTGGFRGNKGKIYEGGLLVPAILEWPAKIKHPVATEMRCTTCDIFPTLLAVAGAEPSPANVPLDGINLLPTFADLTLKTERPETLEFWDVNKKGIGTPAAEWMAELYAAQQQGKDLPPHPSSQDAAKLPSPVETIESLGGHSAIISGNWKLHRIVKGDSVEWELYDLKTDPYEKTDLIEKESSQADELKPKLMAWMDSVIGSLRGDDY
ncbi:Arylsulfatase precursor [Roseimaritima multifibrata]|uniref:Arylsulfatase n=1 Tax=Roseimaritima multifibrata TaxID=1930274 RepID=A0A517MM71_9BACT|nr:sulfatase-like hydrolase/transferase [Roseimaritima multifibrata]QDS95996.1 Arylsulfatase precursor [Roseimaritima multifibrata]